MPNIRLDCAEQSSTNFPLQRRHKPNSLAVRLTRVVLMLRSAGSSRRTIAAALGLSHRRVKTILAGAAPADANRCRPFITRERDADYAAVEAALMSGSTLRAEHARYARTCPALLLAQVRRLAKAPARPSGERAVPVSSERIPLAAPIGGAPLEGGLLFISEPDTALQIRKGALCVRSRGGGGSPHDPDRVGSPVERTFPRGRHGLRSSFS